MRRGPDQDMRQSQILDVKEVYVLGRRPAPHDPSRSRGAAERAGARYAAQGLSEYLGSPWPGESFWAGRVGQTRLDLKAFFSEEGSATGPRSKGAEIRPVPECPFWVISGHRPIDQGCPLCPRKRTCSAARSMSALCHKRTLDERL